MNGEWENYRDEPVFRLYFKGLVSVDNVGSGEVPLEGIGVAICDQRDNLVHQLKKPGNQPNARIAELKALSEGLELAISFGLQRIRVCCDNYTLFNLVTGRWTTKQRKIAILLNHISLLLRKFTHHYVLRVSRTNVKFAFAFAKEAVISQVKIRPRMLKESCAICLEDVDSTLMFAVDGCSHRYCCSCINKHVEVQVYNGMLPKCPHRRCKSYISIDRCRSFLNSTLMEIFNKLIAEASIPVTDKFYCPYPRCSALMSKAKVVEHSREVFDKWVGAGKCIQCKSIFCIDCKVPWHTNITCADYKRLNPDPLLEDMKQWRQCVKCRHMIELSEGCNHMTCRCGYEFCYKCGAAFKNEEPTCYCVHEQERIWEAEEQLWEAEEQLWEGYHQIFGF